VTAGTLLAASRCISVFANALDERVLAALAEGPLSPGALEEALAWAPQSSLRRSLEGLGEIGAVTRSPKEGRRRGAPFGLTEAGGELLQIAVALGQWLESCPEKPIRLEDAAARGIVRVLATGWDSMVIRALAERAQSLLELSAGIPQLNYPALKRRLAKLRATGLAVSAETLDGEGYEASDWLRRAVVPLALAARWEHRHDAGLRPMTETEIEATFMLALPLIELSARASGVCALGVLVSERQNGGKPRAAGVCLELKKGEIVSCRPGIPGNQETWALGTLDEWFDALVDGRTAAVRFGGAKLSLAKGIVKALHDDLFRA
jgi:DNA-binding HxlR family transcriptional regulator